MVSYDCVGPLVVVARMAWATSSSGSPCDEHPITLRSPSPAGDGAVLAVFFTWASDMRGIGANFVLAGTSVWSPRRRRIATQLDVVLGKEHHADILKGAANSLSHNRGRLPTFQFEIVDCAFAY